MRPWRMPPENAPSGSWFVHFSIPALLCVLVLVVVVVVVVVVVGYLCPCCVNTEVGGSFVGPCVFLCVLLLLFCSLLLESSTRAHRALSTSYSLLCASCSRIF
jgi:hypothetical protein